MIRTSIVAAIIGVGLMTSVVAGKNENQTPASPEAAVPYKVAAFDVHGVLLDILKGQEARLLKGEYATRSFGELCALREKILNEQCGLCDGQTCDKTTTITDTKKFSHVFSR